MLNIILIAVWLGSVEAVRRGSEKYVLLYDKKSLEQLRQRRSGNLNTWKIVFQRIIFLIIKFTNKLSPNNFENFPNMKFY